MRTRHTVMLPLVLVLSTVLGGCAELGFGEPDYGSLRDDIAEMPGVADATVEIIAEDTESWTSTVFVVVEPDASAEELAEVVETFEDEDAKPEHGLGLKVTVEGEPQVDAYGNGPSTSVLSSEGGTKTPALDRTRWFLAARQALPETDVSLEEDVLIASVKDLTDAVTTIAEDPVLHQVRYLHLYSGSKDSLPVELSAQGPVEPALVDRLESSERALEQLPDGISDADLDFADGSVPPDGGHNDERRVTLSLDWKKGALKAHETALETVVEDLMTAAFEPGEPALFEVEGPDDTLISLGLNNSRSGISTDNEPGWQQFAADVATRELA